MFAKSAPSPPEATPEIVKPLKVSLDGLRAALTDGRIVLPDDEDYQHLRMPWNWDTAGHPAVIVLPANEREVAAAVKFASDNKLKFGVSAGKHSHYSAISNALMIDLRMLKDISIDKDTKTACVGAGMKLGEFDSACAPYNLATTAGTNGDTGLAGLSLGGGAGFLARKFGLTCDNVLSLRVALLDGSIVTANKSENTDLFWALRGGGGNFGVVTQFTYQLYEMPEDSLLYAGHMVYLPKSPLSWIGLQTAPPDALKLHRDNWEKLSNDWMALGVLPAAGPFIAIYCHVGDIETGKKEFADFSPNLGSCLIKDMKPMKYHSEIQSIALGPDKKGQANGYWFEKSIVLNEIPDEVIDLCWEATRSSTHVKGEVLFMQLGGKISELPVEESAFPHRSAKYWVLIFSSWDGKPETRDTCVAWARGIADKLKQFQAGTYQAVGAIHDSEGDAPLSIFGSNLARLKQIKQKYDPENLLCYNQNIKPE